MPIDCLLLLLLQHASLCWPFGRQPLLGSMLMGCQVPRTAVVATLSIALTPPATVAVLGCSRLHLLLHILQAFLHAPATCPVGDYLNLTHG